jgi:hypothetical protein
MIPAPLLPYADFLLGLTLFLSACASVRQGVNMDCHSNMQDDGFTPIKIHYG